jgi:CheY-like chemotaxis protein
VRSEHVLLVDDNELLLSGMKRFFEKDFVHVSASNTGEDAIIHIQKHLYHIVILDINLPGINGWEVLDYIKQKSPLTRVVIITSSEDGAIRQKAISKGATECMGKPFDLDELKYVILNALSLQRTDRVQKTFPVRFGNECKGLVCNLSPTGMFILTDIPCECGTTLDITLDITGEEMIPLKGRVVRTIESVSKTTPFLSAGRMIPEGMDYGLGIKLLEQPPVYSSLVSSLLF